jgi:hypothetical protein
MSGSGKRTAETPAAVFLYVFAGAGMFPAFAADRDQLRSFFI